jgi:hypothetical protein
MRPCPKRSSLGRKKGFLYLPLLSSSHHTSKSPHRITLLLRDLDRTIVDPLDNIVRVLPVYSASDRLSGSEDLLDGTGQVLGEGLVLHLTGDLQEGEQNRSDVGNQIRAARPANTYGDDLVESNVTSVLDVLLLLSVPRRLYKQKQTPRQHHFSTPIPPSHFDSPFKALMTKLEAEGTTETLA